MAKTDIFAELAAAAEAAGKNLLEFCRSLDDHLKEVQAVRMKNDRARKRTKLNPRQLWRRRRAKGRGTKGGARK